MFYSIALAGLYCFGVVWCAQVARRFRDDVVEIRERREVARTGSIVFIWVLTAGIAVVLVLCTGAIIRNLMELVRMFK